MWQELVGDEAGGVAGQSTEAPGEDASFQAQARDLRSCRLLAQRTVPPPPAQLSSRPLSLPLPSQSITKFGPGYLSELCSIPLATVLTSQSRCLCPMTAAFLSRGGGQSL